MAFNDRSNEYQMNQLYVSFGRRIDLFLIFMILANVSFHVLGTEFGSTLIKRPFWIMTAFMFIFMGMQFISLGLLAEIQIRTYHESQGKPIYVIRNRIEPSA